MGEISVLAPATVSNVVCGFDCLGFAVEEPHDEITVRQVSERGIKIIHHDDFGLPTDPEKNVAGVALKAMLRAANAEFGLEVEITKHIRPGSGIGSSSASSSGAVVAANRLLGDRFSKLELVGFAMEGEMLASGARHADNVAPCIFGGFTLVRSTTPLDIVSLNYPELYVTVIHPQIEIKTSEARTILPDKVPLKAAVKNWSNLGAFVAGLSVGDFDLISRSMLDEIIEPVRKSLIPEFDRVKESCLHAGALGGGISGSGPSIFMLSRTTDEAMAIEEAMVSVLKPTTIAFHTYVSRIDPLGVRPI